MRFGKVMPVLVLVTVLVGIVGSYATAAEIPYRTGAILVSPEEYSKLTGFKFVPVTEDVYKHLIEIAPGYPRTPPVSKDALMRVAAPGPVPPDSLPTSVNNSLYLPPIGNQGIVGSCNAWASTYYVWTYMINWFRNNPRPHTVWDIMNPTFTYNLINDGQVSDVNGDGRVEDHGSIVYDAMNLISTVGAVPYGAFQVYNGLNYGLWDEDWNSTIVDWYNNDHASFNNWLAHAISVWPEEAQWKEAPYNRGLGDMYDAALKGWFYVPQASQAGIIYILDLTNSTQFQYLRGLLAAGYVAETGITVYDDFRYFDTTNNIYALNHSHSGNPGGHAVTIVGYDDNKITPDGHGAFLMVNSWGTTWGDHGYWWLTYQAAQDPNHKISDGHAYIFVPQEPQPYKPKVYASFKVTHPKRGEVIGGLFKQDCPEGHVCFPPKVHGGIELGVNVSGSLVWNRRFFDFWIGYQHYPYDGLANYQAHPFPDSPIVLDLTDSLDALTTSTAVSSQYVPFYIKLADKYQDGVTGSLDSFSIIINSTYLHEIARAEGEFPTSIPENGSWLVVSADVPILNYTGITPLNKQVLNTNWTYIEIGSIVNITNATLHFGEQDYQMVLDGPYHAFYNVSNLDAGTYTYSVSVTLTNGNTLELPQRTVYVVSKEKIVVDVPLDPSEWENDETVSPGNATYLGGTFVWKDILDSGVSLFTGITYDIESLQMKYSSESGMLYLKIKAGPLDNLGRTPAPLIKVYFDVNGDDSWDYYAVIDLVKNGVSDDVPTVLDVYSSEGVQIGQPQALFIPDSQSSSVYVQIPEDLIGLSEQAQVGIKVELYEHDGIYGPLDALNTAEGGESTIVDLQQVPMFNNLVLVGIALAVVLFLFRRS